MAVVQESVMELRGHLTIESVAGLGTTFRMYLPLSLATVEALTVEASGQVYAIPLNQAIRVLRASQALDSDRQVVQIDDREITCYALPTLVGRSGHRIGDLGASGRIVVVGTSGRYAALAVERSLGVEEVVVRPLQGALAGIGGIEGVSVLADGTTAYVLNVMGLLKLAHGDRS